MQYTRDALTFEAQARLLISRGLDADVGALSACLKSVNYYRLMGYLHPFQLSDGTFRPGTTLDKAWRRYTFDRQLRLLVLDGVERVEVAVRTQLVYQLAHTYGPFGYMEACALPNLEPEEHLAFKSSVTHEANRSREFCVTRFVERYGDMHPMLPIWILAEVIGFGHLLTMYRGASNALQSAIAEQFDQPREVLLSWLRALNSVRNICAHHGRLWNRELGYRPAIPRKHKNPQWHIPVKIQNNRIFCILLILRYLLRTVAPRTNWPLRVEGKIAEYPDIPAVHMGFPEAWEKHSLWV